MTRLSLSVNGRATDVDVEPQTLLVELLRDHLHLTGTGLTHLGSASARDAMHAKLEGAETLTDSMKMFRAGLEGGRPPQGRCGTPPEWFYKGTGSALRARTWATSRSRRALCDSYAARAAGSSRVAACAPTRP